MHRAGHRGQRPADGVSDGLAQVAQPAEIRLRHRQLMVEIDEATVDLLLVDGLAGSRCAHLRGTIRGDHQQGNAAFLRLDDGGKVVGGRRPAGADQRDGPALLPGQAEGEEGGGAFIEDRNHLQPGLTDQRKNQGR